MTQLSERRVAVDDRAGGGVVLPPPEAYLCRWDGAARLHRWDLPAEGGVRTVGRSASADIRLEGDPQVSRLHCVLECVAGQWTVEDDGISRNGTYVNGVRVAHRTRLRDRDVLRLGTTSVTFCAPQPVPGEQTATDGPLAASTRLTPQQRAVLAALCRAYAGGEQWASPATNQQIAAELCISVDAVKAHLRVLFARLGIADLPQNQKRARLVEIALQLGLSREP